MGGARVLAAVQDLEEAHVEHLAAVLGLDVISVLQACREHRREGHLENVAPLTYSLTAEGSDHLTRLLQEDGPLDVGSMDGVDADAEPVSLSAATGRDHPTDLVDRILATVRYLDRAEVVDVAEVTGTDVLTAFCVVRTLLEEGHLTEVRPMTYRLTDAGVDHLERLDPADGEGTTDPADVLDGEPTGKTPATEAVRDEEGHPRSGPLTLREGE